MNSDELKERLRRPTETLQLELKSWIGVVPPKEKAIIARTLIALRNVNGGILVFGFNDGTLAPEETGRPADVRQTYAPDLLQKIVADFAEPAFPVAVEFVERDGLEFPVVIVPAGVELPVMSRQEVKHDDGRLLLRHNQVYVRSIHSDVVQTTEPRSREDWDDLMRICFNNREADVGQFLRRNLGKILEELGLTLRSEQVPARPAGEAAPASSPATLPVPIVMAREVRTPETVIEEGAARYAGRVQSLRTRQPPATVPEGKAWRETGIVLTGPIKPLAGQHILHAVFPRHPRHSGWPMWIDSRGMEEWQRPYPLQGGWEALAIWANAPFLTGPLIDFWRIDPRGEFYDRRNLEDDLWPSVPPELRGTVFDIINGIKRVAEGLATVQSFAHGMSTEPETANLRAAFRWTGLQGRKLISVEPGRDFLTPPVVAEENVVSSAVEMPVSTAPGAIGSYVNQAVGPLFAAFGYQVPRFVIDELTDKVVKLHLN